MTDRRAVVRALQRALNDNGYPLVIDGAWGHASASALAEAVRIPEARKVAALGKPDAFFVACRATVMGPTLDQGEVDGAGAILAACGADGWPVAWTAYALATAWHETAHTLQPIKERGGTAYFTRLYDVSGQNPGLAARLGNTKPGDGALFAGRGYVQLTGRANYKRAGEKLNVGLEQHPDLALEPKTAARIMVEGMRDGWFTGKRLSDYLDQTPPDYLNARRIINGTDKAAQIALYAAQFANALKQGEWA